MITLLEKSDIQVVNANNINDHTFEIPASGRAPTLIIIHADITADKAHEMIEKLLRIDFS